MVVVEQGIQGVASVAQLRHDQRIFQNLRQRYTLFRRQRVLRSRDNNQFIAMNHLRIEPIVRNRQGNYAEIHHVLKNRFQDARVIGALDAHGNIRIIAFKLREDLGQDVEARALIGAHDNLAARDSLGFGNLGENRFALLQRLLGILEKQFAGGSEGDASARAVEQAGAYFFFKCANLGGNGGLGGGTLFCGAGETGESGDLQENFELIEVHRVLASDTITSSRQWRKRNPSRGKAPP